MSNIDSNSHGLNPDSEPIEESPFRERFVFESEDEVYLDGNSLGRLPHATAKRIEQLVRHEWGGGLIASWNQHWLGLAQRIGDKIGHILGASPNETIVCDSTSVNLFKLAWALLQHRHDRRVVVTDAANFPSDLYVLDAVAKSISPDIQILAIDFESLDHENVISKLAQSVTDQTALVCLSHVQFKSGYAFDMHAVNQLCRKRGAYTLWDLSHSVGAIPIDLPGTLADAAVGCTYKYLNGGPGAPAFLFVRQELQKRLSNPIAGWFGAKNPFDFGTNYIPNPTLERFLVGTPHILSTAAIEPGVDLVLEAGMSWIHARSVFLCERLIRGFDQKLERQGYSLITPRVPTMRGSHISLTHEHGWQITQDLIQRYRVIPDFRTPNVIRLGIVPLYNQQSDIDRVIAALEASVINRTYADFSQARIGVT